ncbi:ABC transporter permease subunit [Synechococcales cyanobacterium C]|uniref:ABC transporter permease subunit n=1 Tax=Petrachloros mirabilis ULC683 TaxID=2781853 RepID=A0A8K2A5Z7_9CYAN|nr:ABC transporter permease subunit [Petrachloros mirabilis ULC683]
MSPGAQRPTQRQLTVSQWLGQNLFATWSNTLLTLVCLAGLGLVGGMICRWLLLYADLAVISTNLRLFWVGRYPLAQTWRLWGILTIASGTLAISWTLLVSLQRRTLMAWIALGLVNGAFSLAGGLTWGIISGLCLWIVGGLSLGQFLRHRHPTLPWLWLLPVQWVLALVTTLWLLGGGWGLTPVSTAFWNGLLLTVLLAVISIGLSFPLGILLALGRRSSLPVIRGLCVIYIEGMRGLPLIGVLFMAQVMVPLVLPPSMQLDQVLRGIIGLTLFSAAYLAENVRGGLQSIPPGQTEAAQALGLSAPLVLGLIVLPQALRAVIPALVGQFIGLFKDTSLLAIVGLVELTRMGRSILAQPQFQGRYLEVYLFTGLIYWICCYGLSMGSRRIEAILKVGQR